MRHRTLRGSVIVSDGEEAGMDRLSMGVYRINRVLRPEFSGRSSNRPPAIDTEPFSRTQGFAACFAKVCCARTCERQPPRIVEGTLVFAAIKPLEQLLSPFDGPGMGGSRCGEEFRDHRAGLSFKGAEIACLL